MLPPGSPPCPQWAAMYVLPLVNWTGAISWRIVHLILPTNILLHHFSVSIPSRATSVWPPEDWYHAYVDCAILTPFFTLLSQLCCHMNIFFSLCTFIFGLPLISKNPVESALTNFLIAEGKLAIYKTRKAKLLANSDADSNVLRVF